MTTPTHPAPVSEATRPARGGWYERSRRQGDGEVIEGGRRFHLPRCRSHGCGATALLSAWNRRAQAGRTEAVGDDYAIRHAMLVGYEAGMEAAALAQPTAPAGWTQEQVATWDKATAALMARAQPEPTGADAVEKLGEVAAFLMGEKPLDGVWFGEDHPSFTGLFWWRSYLRDALRAIGWGPK